MRINRYLASCGLGARRKMDELVAAGRVRVNGAPPEGPGMPIDPSRDVVEVDGAVVRPQEDVGVWLCNKPAGLLTTMDDPEGRPTVRDLVAHLDVRLFPVGRLDMGTEGLLLLTNDGKLAHRLAHPRYGVEKEYRVTVRGTLGDTQVAALERGVDLEEGTTSPARVTFRQPGPQRSVFQLVIHEGWNRQVRRMAEAVGLPVLGLERVRYAFLTLEGVERGGLRRLRPDEVARLERGATAPG